VRVKGDQLTRAATSARVAVVIVNYRTPDLTKQCLAALRSEKQLLATLEVVVVDGGSADASADELRRAIADPIYSHWVSLLPLQENGGFGWANNQAIVTLLSDSNPPQFIHLLNPDTVVARGAVAHLSRYLEQHAETAVVGSQLLESDGSLSGSAFHFPTLRGELARGARTQFISDILRVPTGVINASEAREVDWVTGASFMVRTEALKQVGLFDEVFFLYH